MKRLLRKSLALLLCLSLCISYVPFAAADNVASGTWGNLSWTLDSDGLLTISGSGEIYDFTYDNPSAWLLHRSQIISVKINSGISSIGEYAFSYCNYLTSITVPSGVESIGSNAFINCNSLRSITIPSGVQSIGSNAFSNCRNLASIIIPSSVTEIGTDAFIYCGGLKTAGPIGSGCDYQFGWEDNIPGNAFTGCLSLTTVTIPSGVTSIGYAAFNNCLSLTSITLPSGVESIRRLAFASCSNLTSISIPSSVAIIYDNAFGSGLTDVYYEGTQAQWNAIVIESPNEALNNATIHFNDSPTPCEHNYSTADIVNRKNPSLTESGQIVYQCTKCDALITEYYPVLNETDYLLEHAVEPTCSETGRDDYTYMGNTAQHLTFSVELPIVDHDYVNGVCRFCGQTDPNGGSGYDTGSGISVFESTGDPVITSFRFYQDVDGTEYVDLTDSTDTLTVEYNGSANPYKFVIVADRPEFINHIYITGTAPDGVHQMEAEYDTIENAFVAQGFFDANDVYFQPENIKLEYSVKATAPEVGNSLNWDEMLPYLGVLTNATVTNTPSGNTNTGVIDFSGTVEELSNLGLKYTIKAIDSSFGTELATLRSYYKDGIDIASYVVPGLDDSKYYAYLDYSDPWTYKMFLDDGLEIGSKAIELQLSFIDVLDENYVNLWDTLGVFKELSTISEVIGNAHKINLETEDIKQQINESTTIVNKTEANQKVDEYHDDKMCFMLMAYALPKVVAAVGVMGGAPGMLFTAIIGVMSAVSNSIYDYRVGGILGSNKIETRWNQVVDVVTGLCGEHLLFTATLYSHYEYDKNRKKWDNYNDYSELVISGFGDMYDNIPEDSIVYPEVYHWGGSYYPSGSKLINVTLPSGLTNISKGFFENCNYLTSVVIPDTVTRIEKYAFSRMSRLDSIKIPDSVDYIGERAFWQCDALHKVSFGRNLREIGYQAFYECVKLQNVIFNGNQLKIIGNWAFQKCGELSNVNLPDSVEYIGTYAFAECSKLYDFILPDSLIEIGNCAFYGTHIQSIFLPSSLKYATQEVYELAQGYNGDYYYESSYVRELEGSGYNSSGDGSAVSYYGDYEPYATAFTGMDYLTEITVDSSNVYFTSNTGVLFDKEMLILLCFPTAKKGNYSIPETVKVIGCSSFYGKKDYRGRIIIPSGIAHIGAGAFSYLGADSYDNSLHQQVSPYPAIIFQGNFQSAHSFLNSATVDIYSPSSMENYLSVFAGSCTDYHWYDISQLSNPTAPYSSVLILPQNLIFIESEAFSNVSAEAVVVPVSVTRIEDGAFTNIVIIGVSGSEAEAYCERNGLTFIDVDDYYN